VSVTIDDDQHLQDIVRELEGYGTVTVESHQTIVSVVGNEIAQTQKMLSRLFDSLDTIPVSMVSYGGSRHNISLLVPSDYKVKTLQVLNKGLFGLE
jgi:aspartate kinase